MARLQFAMDSKCRPLLFLVFHPEIARPSRLKQAGKAECHHPHRIAHINLDAGMEPRPPVFSPIHQHIHPQIAPIFRGEDLPQDLAERLAYAEDFRRGEIGRQLLLAIRLRAEEVPRISAALARAEDRETFVADASCPIDVKFPGTILQFLQRKFHAHRALFLHHAPRPRCLFLSQSRLREPEQAATRRGKRRFQQASRPGVPIQKRPKFGFRRAKHRHLRKVCLRQGFLQKTEAAGGSLPCSQFLIFLFPIRNTQMRLPQSAEMRDGLRRPSPRRRLAFGQPDTPMLQRLAADGLGQIFLHQNELFPEIEHTRFVHLFD